MVQTISYKFIIKSKSNEFSYLSY